MKAFVGILIIINSLILFFLNIIRLINQFDWLEDMFYNGQWAGLFEMFYYPISNLVFLLLGFVLVFDRRR
ncbi:hypothetical protein N8376_06770 [Flavobacteriaceae bacterium]|nr:hypothetical protein [Flavobacteriaceae bacterium]